MKTYLPLIFVAVSASMLCSCGYQTLADAEYLPQQVYMPAAVNGIYVVDDVAPDYGPSKYALDMEAGRLNIPLSIYRSGTDNDGAVTVALEVSLDSVRTLMDDGELDDESGVAPLLLPGDKMMVPDVINIPDGAETGTFNLSVDLDFLMSNPRTRYVTGIGMKSSDHDIVKTLNYIVVVIDTRFVVPTVTFTCRVTDDANYVVSFENASEYGFDYQWDFGDGSDIFVGEDPGTHQYPSSGRYDVVLTARGITGDIFTQLYNLRLWENITSKYLLNYGPFKRKDSGGKTGTLADWQYTPNVLGANGKGGFYLESGGVMDFYSSSKDMVNAKIYQTITLPAGNYRAAFTPHAFRGTNECCYVATAAAELPDIENVGSDDKVLGCFRWAESLDDDSYGFEFALSAETTVTLGFVVSNTAKSRVQISSVSLYK